MSSKSLFLTMGMISLLAFLVTGCPSTEQQQATCDGVTCSDHGTCVLTEGKAACNCDNGYEAQGLTCVQSSTCLELGEECTDSSQCCESWCLKYTGQDKGYCTKRDCQGNDSCVNHGTDSAEMCCVDVGGEYFICMKIAEGYTCGDGTGMCGSSCAGQMDSACDSSQACLSTGADDPNAVCAHECATDNECADCSDPNDENKVFSCQAISGGVTYCLVDNSTGCESSFDCEDPDVCVAWPSDDQQSLEGKCANLGDLPAGATCDDNADPNNLPAEERCSDFYCINGHCSEVCALENDCPENMVCGTINFQMDNNGTIASIGMCMWMEGSGDTCDGNDDCPDGEICDYYLPPDGSVNKVCATERCDPADDGCAGPGDACGTGLDECYTGLCLVSQGSADGWCSALCNAHADCPSGMVCGLLGVSETETTGACVPFDGSAQACGGDGDCPDGEACNYVASPAAGVESLCATMICDPADENCSFIGDPCGQGENPCYNDLCLTDGTNSWCGAVCETSEDCPDGYLCGGLQFQGDPGVYGACAPASGSGDPCDGDADCTTEGEVCEYNQSPNGDIESLCLEQSCDPTGDNCGGVGDDCGQDMPPCYNDLCLTNGTNSWCSAPCVVHEDCPAGWLCGGLQFSGSDSVVGACVEAEGSGTPCANEDDCSEATEACQFVAPPNQPIESLCLTGVADGAAPGETCDQNTPCFNDLCLTAGYCSAVCTTNVDCSGYLVDSVAMECVLIGMGNDQYAKACVGAGDTSPLCSFCTTSDECTGDAKCKASDTNAGEMYCTLPCPNGDECPNGSTCTDIGSGDMQCVPNGDTCMP